ncbi:MAG: PAS domain S-box protein, partial [Thermodesulfobacteriota bacterium]|nr:PAS domain S-box protein [Thermodesulfobacteriota bacterium]
MLNHRRVENGLNRGERVYREVFDAFLDGMLIIDLEGTIIDINDAFCKIAGHSYDELVETNIRDLIYPRHWCDLNEFMSKIQRRGKAQLKGAKIQKDNSAFTVEVYGVKLSDYDKLSFVVTVRDIFDNAPTEESIRESERRYKTILENAPLGISIMRDDLIFEYFNPKFTEIFGYTKEDLPDKKTWFNKAYPDEAYRKKAAYTWENDLVKSEKIGEVEPRTFTVRCKNGLDKIIRFRVVSLEHGGQLLTYENITTKSMTKAALRQSEKRFRDLANLLPQTIFETDRKGNITFVNRNGLKSFGYSQEDIDNGLNAIQLYIPEDREEVIRISQTILRGKNIEEVEFTALRKDGSTFPILIYPDVIMGQDKPSGLRGILLDMTERKRAEKALKDSEEKYRVVVENANEGITVVQDGTLRFVNNFIIDLLGYSKDKLTSQPFIEFVHPDDRELVMRHYDESLKVEKIAKKYNLRVVDKNGNIKWVQNSGVIIEWAERPATLNFLIDITEQKQTLYALQEIEETQKAILAASPVGIGLVRNRIVFWVNKAMYDMLGYEEGSLLGEPARVFYPNDEEYERVGCELYPIIEKRGTGKV